MAVDCYGNGDDLPEKKNKLKRCSLRRHHPLISDPRGFHEVPTFEIFYFGRMVQRINPYMVLS